MNAFIEVGGGYRVWAEPYEDQKVADGRVGVWFGSNILLLGHYEGQVSSPGADGAGSAISGLFEGNGRVTVQHVDYSRLTSHVAGPEVRYRVDDRLDVFAGSSHTMAGKNSIHGDAYYVGMAFRQSKHNRLQGLLGIKSQP